MSQHLLTFCPRRYTYRCLVEGTKAEIDAHLESTANQCGDIKQDTKTSPSDWFGIFRDERGVLKTLCEDYLQILDHIPDPDLHQFVYRNFSILAIDEANGRIHITYRNLSHDYDLKYDEWIYSPARIRRYRSNPIAYSMMSESIKKEIDPSNIRFVFKWYGHQKQIGDYFVYDDKECQKIKESIEIKLRSH